MKYRKGYKYQLAEDQVFHTPITPPHNINTEFLHLGTDGVFVIDGGYAWDGPSGLTWDTKNSMTPSLGHDGFFELLRKKELNPLWLDPVNSYLYDCLIANRMSRLRAGIWYRAVDQFADFAADPKNAKKVYEVP